MYFVALVVSGKHDEAIERFYTENATLQENLGDIRKGPMVLSLANVLLWPVSRKSEQPV